MRIRRGSVVAAVLVATLLPASVAPATEADRRQALLRRMVDSLPVEVGAAQGGRASNVMFASFQGGRHRGYSWTVQAYKAGPRDRTHLTILFTRSAARQTQWQTSEFTWTLTPRALSLGRKLKPSSLSTGRGMGDNGRISMGLAAPTQYFRATPEGCSGSVEYRVGRFTGKLRFHARDLFFRRVSLDRARVVLYRERSLSCPGTPPSGACPEDVSLTAADPDQGVALGAFRTAEGRVDLQVAAARPSGDAESVHRISVQVAVPEAFETSDDMTTADVDADVAAPWLSGDLSYLAPPPPEDGADDGCGPYRSTSGVVTGDFTAHFDSIGDVTPATTGMDATLRRAAP